MLASTGRSVETLMRDMDKNNDGMISKPEFRLSVKHTLRMADERTSEIDALFDAFDSDGSGDLELREVSAALQKLIDASHQSDRKTAQVLERAAKLREAAEAFDKAAEDAAAHEAAEARFAAAWDPVEARLGLLLTKRNIKIGDMVHGWDSNGNGLIEPDEFREHILALGLKDDGTGLDALFRSLDKDGSGTLDIDEIKAALKRIRESAAKAAVDEHWKRREVAAMLKTARASQVEAQRVHDQCHAVEA